MQIFLKESYTKYYNLLKISKKNFNKFKRKWKQQERIRILCYI